MTTPDVNERLIDEQIRHQVHVLRLTSGIAGRMVALLERSEFRVMARLTERLARIEERGFDTGPQTTRRLEQMLRDFENARAKVHASAGDALRSELEEFVEYEQAWQIQHVENVVTPVGLSVTAPSLTRTCAAAFSQPFQTRLLRAWVADLAANERRQVAAAVRSGIVEGLTTPQIAREVRNLMGTTTRHATAIARTATNHVANAARKELGRANGDIIKGVRYVATLDSRTTPICRALDGKVFDIDKGPRPPQHINCRSTITYILKGLPGNTGTRASFRGQVPAAETYNTWLRKQPRDFIDDVLGSERAKLYVSGKLSLDKFVDRSGRQYTIAELRRRQPEAFQRAG